MKKRILALLLVSVLCFSLTGCKSSDYKKAVELQGAGDFAAALTIYEELGDYEDAGTRLEECKKAISYNEAISLLENKKYEDALAIFTTIEDYQDSAEKKVFCEEMTTAIAAFETAVTELQAKNDELDNEISAANEVVQSEDKALDETLRTSLETAISDSKAKKISIPEMPESSADINAKTSEMTAVDYSEVLTDLTVAKEALETSIAQYALVNNPEEGYVIACLQTVPGVMDISAVTEDNDPNGNLGKAGCYTAAVYFSHENVNQNDVYGTTIIDKGTDCGGQIEVYANEEDAIKRNEYLAGFDGSIFASGSHTVIGTCVIRTSNELKASQQKELEANIIAALTKID